MTTKKLFSAFDSSDRELLQLALSTLEDLLRSPTSADREARGDEQADAWIDRLKQLSAELDKTESTMIKTSLTLAVNSADYLVCNGYKIDGISLDIPGYIRLDCGDDVIAILKEQQVEIDDYGDCRIKMAEDEVAERYATEIEVGGDALITFKVAIPVRHEDLALA
jgi:hypothetical protein